MDWLILLQSILYFSIAVLGFLVAIPLEKNRSDLDGKCILYATLHKVKTNHYIFLEDGSTCRYVFSTGLCGIIIGLLAGLCFGYIALKSKKDKNIGTRMWMMVFVVLNAVLSLISLVAACMLAIGFRTINSKCGDEICTVVIIGRKLSNFVILQSLSEISAWVGTILYFLLTGISILTLLRNKGLLQSRNTKTYHANNKRPPCLS